uniref:Uncharacterized protein n=1 Tax=Rhizophora mucronata TaxID=61149 RepID=A0A2P2N0B2_RHIMU
MCSLFSTWKVTWISSFRRNLNGLESHLSYRELELNVSIVFISICLNSAISQLVIIWRDGTARLIDVFGIRMQRNSIFLAFMLEPSRAWPLLLVGCNPLSSECL